MEKEINKIIPNCVNEFLNHLEYYLNRSKATQKTYKYTILRFTRYVICKRKNNFDDLQTVLLDIEDSFYNAITEIDIISYITHMARNGASSSSKNNAQEVLKSFFKYLKKNKIIENNVTLELDSIKIEKREPVFLEVNQVKELKDNMKIRQNKRFQLRESTIILVDLYTGLRRQEMCDIKLENLDIENRKLQVIGKGNKQRTIYLAEGVIKVINEYLEFRNNYCEKNNMKSEYLFIGQGKEKLSIEVMGRNVNNYLKTLGFEKITMHKLRHSFSSILAEKGVNVVNIQELLGHSSLSVTSRYVHSSETSLKQSVNKLKF